MPVMGNIIAEYFNYYSMIVWAWVRPNSFRVVASKKGM